MKNIIIKLLIIAYTLSLFNANIVQNTYAVTWDSDSIKITVGEKVPWANCTEKEKKNENDPQLYECNIAKWFAPVTVMLWNIIKYFTYLALLGWVLFIIVNGIIYSMGWLDDSMKSGAKTRITSTLIWLVLLFLSWVILNIIAPWIYK